MNMYPGHCVPRTPSLPLPPLPLPVRILAVRPLSPPVGQDVHDPV